MKLDSRSELARLRVNLRNPAQVIARPRRLNLKSFQSKQLCRMTARDWPPELTRLKRSRAIGTGNGIGPWSVVRGPLWGHRYGRVPGFLSALIPRVNRVNPRSGQLTTDN